MKILVYPKDPNPYQELIYSRLRPKIEIKYLENPTRSGTVGLLMLFLQLVYYRIKGYTILHLHWFYTFYPPLRNWLLNNALTRALYSLLFIIFILFIKILRYRLIWTVHNVVPLVKQFINSVGIMKILSNLSNSKIVHSKTTLENMKKLHISTRFSYIIPHGSYSGIYINNICREDAREKVGVDKKNFVFCFLGRIESYKGVLELLHDFLSLNEENLGLIVAGECRNRDLKRRILDYKSYSNIILHLEFIKDDDIQIYLNTADVIVYPFQTITTSGSVILALSFGKPIIYPKMGNLRDLPGDIGFSYKPDGEMGLLNCMKKAISNKAKLREMGKNALKYAESFSWDKIAEKTYKVYKDNFSLIKKD